MPKSSGRAPERHVAVIPIPHFRIGAALLGAMAVLSLASAEPVAASGRVEILAEGAPLDSAGRPGLPDVTQRL
jgi:hypothetical protein